MISNQLLFLTLLSLPRVGRKTALNFYKNKTIKLESVNDIYEAIKLYISKGKKFPNISKELINEGFNKSDMLIKKFHNCF